MSKLNRINRVRKTIRPPLGPLTARDLAPTMAIIATLREELRSVFGQDYRLIVLVNAVDVANWTDYAAPPEPGEVIAEEDT